MGRDVIVACDFSSKEEVLSFLDKFQGRKPFVKIGMELFYAEGPQIVKEIKARGHKIFLDLKLHDIPNTVKKSMNVLSNLDVDITNLHAGGTKRMMEAALEGLTREDGTRPLLIAVTQLTSTDQESMENDLLIKEPIDKVVMHYAKNAADAGLDGVVCSPLEAGKVHDVKIRIAGSGDVRMEITGGDFNAKVLGSGEITASGEAETFYCGLQGNLSVLDGKELTVNYADIHSKGTAQIYLKAIKCESIEKVRPGGVLVVGKRGV